MSSVNPHQAGPHAPTRNNFVSGGNPSSIARGSILHSNESPASKEIHVHLSSLPEVFAEYETSLRGIDPETIAKRRDLFGVNAFSKLKSEPLIIKYGKHYLNGFSVFFILAAILCLAVFNLSVPPDRQTMWLGIALLVVVFLTGTFDSYQAYKATKALTFEALSEGKLIAIRDGEPISIAATDIVMGDLIKLENGTRVAADMRIVECADLKIDFSTLTGEPDPLPRTVDHTDHNPTETSNLAFAGTYVTEGTGFGVVYAVGDETLLGTIAASANKAKQPQTNMERELHWFVIIMAVGALALAIVFVIMGATIQKLNWKALLSIFIAGIICNVPEGLLPQLSAQLTLTANRMKQKNVSVKNMKIIETIGVATVIASDKTGTLTMNRMSVSHLWYNKRLCVFGAMDDAQSTRFEIGKHNNEPAFQELFQNLILNNNAEFTTHDVDPETSGVMGGNATDIAFIRFGQKIVDVKRERAKYRKVYEIPFNSRTKWALTVCEISGEFVVFIKGAVERVMERSVKIQENGKERPFIPSDNTAIMEVNTYLSGFGERVLSFAYIKLGSQFKSLADLVHQNEVLFPLDKFTFLGLVSVIDPPRPEVPGSIRKCQQAGIQVIMVTGDHPLTATSIARQIGIISGTTRDEVAQARRVTPHQVPFADFDAIVTHGDELEALTDESWTQILSKKQVVFARTLPEQKQTIVKKLQAINHKVIVTGDGTNDCPALKQADCGIAMGKNGTDIAKDAAQVVLLDDNFASIVSGIEEGRLIFENMKKCVFYTLCHLLPEILPFVLFLGWGFPLAMETIMVLAIDLGTELAPSISMSFEECEDDIMKKPPRDLKNDKLYSWRMFFKSYAIVGVIESIGTICVFCLALSNYGFNTNELWKLGAVWTSSDSDLSDDDLQSFTKLELKNEVFRARRSEFADFNEFRNFALDSSQQSFLWSLVIVQIANAMTCSRSYNPLYNRPFKNIRLYMSFLISIALMSLISWAPFLNSVFSTKRPQFKSVALSFATFPIILFIGELLKVYHRRGKLLWMIP